MSTSWIRLCSTTELCLSNTLRSGQSFSWQWMPSFSAWVSPLDDFVVALREFPPSDSPSASSSGLEVPDDDAVFFRVFGGSSLRNREARVRSYFRCDGDGEFPRLSEMYEEWGAADANFKAKSSVVTGLRILKQDPAECLFSFLCSQNNNVKRIAGMLQRFREEFGERIATEEELRSSMRLENAAMQEDRGEGDDGNVEAAKEEEEGEEEEEEKEEGDDEKEREGMSLFRFPSLEEIRSKATEDRLREMGFGYRSAYVVKSAAAIESKGGEEWLRSLASVDRDTARSELIALPGIGPKVADCILLFCLDHLDVVPVDTHVRQIYERDYRAGKSAASAQSLTPAVYQQIGSFFRSKFGSRAGWAHSILFAADLRTFREEAASGSRPKSRQQPAKRQRKRS